MRRQARYDEQRKRIIFAAAKLFRKKSFSNASIDEVAKSLSINKATIYYYFPSKADLLYEIMFSAIDEFLVEVSAIIATEASHSEKLESMVKLHLKYEMAPGRLGGLAPFEMRNLPLKQRKLYNARRDEYEHIFRSVIQEGIRSNYFRVDDVEMTSRLILGVIHSVTTWFRTSGPLSEDEIGDKVVKFILRSIRSR